MGLTRASDDCNSRLIGDPLRSALEEGLLDSGWSLVVSASFLTTLLLAFLLGSREDLLALVNVDE